MVIVVNMVSGHALISDADIRCWYMRFELKHTLHNSQWHNSSRHGWYKYVECQMQQLLWFSSQCLKDNGLIKKEGVGLPTFASNIRQYYTHVPTLAHVPLLRMQQFIGHFQSVLEWVFIILECWRKNKICQMSTSPSHKLLLARIPLM